MLFPIRELIKDHSEPLCVQKGTKIRDALALMMNHDYSQLPVIDEEGKLTGIITEQSIIYTYSVIGTRESLLDMTVDHCQCSVKKFSPDDNLYDALDQLEKYYAVVVVENQKPIGIVTAYDTTHFFSNYSESLIKVQDIEILLRQHIVSVLDSENKMKAALLHAFGYDKKDSNFPAKEFSDLTFGETISLIVSEKNWSKFVDIFVSKPIFFGFMEHVRDIRNQVMHFRGELSNIQKKHLNQASDWLAARPRKSLAINVIDNIDISVDTTIHVYTKGTKGKFVGIEDWLINYPGSEKTILIPIYIIEEMIEGPLPESALKYRAWWTNDYSTPQAAAWIRAGWLVQSVDLTENIIIFRKTIQAQYLVFFSDLLERITKERAGITRADRVLSVQNSLSIINRGGCSFNWVLPKESFLRVEVYIDVGDRQSNKLIFGLLKKQKDVIEGEIGEKLIWDELVESKASRIYTVTPFRVTKSPEEHEPVKQWGVEMMIKFIDAFLPRMTSL